jgi:hypothetical protein
MKQKKSRPINTAISRDGDGKLESRSVADLKLPLTAERSTEPDKVYERAPFKTISRATGFLVLLLLNFALLGSVLTRLLAHQRLNLQLELFTFLVVLFFDASILWPTIFELKRIRLWSDRLSVNTLFWEQSLLFKEILTIKQPLFFAITILKTKSCSYIINKQDFPQYTELVQILEEKIGLRKF